MAHFAVRIPHTKERMRERTGMVVNKKTAETTNTTTPKASPKPWYRHKQSN